MKLYCVSEKQFDENMSFAAGIKARDDAEKIMEMNGAEVLEIKEFYKIKKNLFEKFWLHVKNVRIWKKLITSVENDGAIFLQAPLIYHTIFIKNIIKKLKKKNVKTMLLIHDLETLRLVCRDDVGNFKKTMYRLEEGNLLKTCDNIIAHNPSMVEQLVKAGVNREKIVSLGIFDYLLDDSHELPTPEYGEPIIIAGNLRPHKAAYAYSLPDKSAYNLYGLDYTGKGDNIHYFGAFPSDELPFVMHGSFGLVWDGESVETCSGAYGQYLKINNPHKTSLYLACGIPVIIWSQAALAPFILENNVGIVVDSLNDIPEVSPEDYAVMRDNAMKIGAKLRRGEMLKAAVEKCL